MGTFQTERLQQFVTEATGVRLPVVVHEQVDSTNDWAVEYCRSGGAIPLACFARHQTMGRGRRGKSWQMAADASIAMSLCWSFASEPSSHDTNDDAIQAAFAVLPLCVAMSIVKTLEGAGLKGLGIKWPNDVYVHGRKIAGILIDAINTRHAGQVFVIGIGLNYDLSVIKDDLSAAGIVYTDVCDESGDGQPSIDALSERLLSDLVCRCDTFPNDVQSTLAAFREGYDYLSMKPVELLLDDGERMQGIARGVTDQAELCVQVGDEIRCLNSAEVSVGLPDQPVPDTSVSGLERVRE